jgi:multidrug efflux pump subunit AcrA (membrane-fusion protein)
MRPVNPYRSYPWLAISTRVVVATAVLGMGVFIFMALVMSRPKPAESSAGLSPPRVMVMIAKPVRVRRPWRGYGVAHAMREAAVPARVSATVRAIPAGVEPGYAVKAGDVLVQLDPTDFERELTIARQRLAELDAQLAQLDVEQNVLDEQWELATSDLTIAGDELKRVEQMFDRNAESQQGLDRTRRSLIGARQNLATIRAQREAIGPRRQQLQAGRAGQAATVAMAQTNLQRTIITSPITGILESVAVEIGENVRAGDQVASVVDLSRIEAPIRLPASARSAMAMGDAVTLTAGPEDAAAGPRKSPSPQAPSLARTWTGRITRIAPTDDAETRTLTVYVELEQAGGNDPAVARASVLNPGTFVSATVVDNDAQMRWVTPRRAVREQRVYLVTSAGQVISRTAKIDFGLEGALPELGLPDDDQWAVIDAELQEGERVVLDASSTQLDGQVVEAVAGSGQALEDKP